MKVDRDRHLRPGRRAVFNLAWPLALKAMMLHGIVVIDTYLVASLGEAAIAAMGLAGALAGLVLGCLFAFSSATQIRIAQAFGATDARRLKTGFYCGLLINLAVAGLGLLLIWLAGGAIIGSFAHTDWVAQQAQNYLAVFAFVIVSEAIGECLSSHFNGCGQTRIPFLSYLIALPLNILTSIVLIHGLLGMPALGVVGAAAGTAVASVVRALFLSLLFYGNNKAFRDVPGWLDGTFQQSSMRHLIFALPIAGTFVCNTVSSQVCTLLYAQLSIHDFAAMTLITPWVVVAGTLGMSWAQSTGIIVAQLLGRNATSADLDRFLGKAWRSSFVAATLASATYGLICVSAGWLYGGLEPETTAALFSFLVVLLLLPFPKQSNAICGNTLRAAGDTVYVMNVFVGSQWLFKVPMTALFILYLDLSVTWVFALLLFEEVVKFPAFHLRIFKGDWKRQAEAVPAADTG